LLESIGLDGPLIDEVLRRLGNEGRGAAEDYLRDFLGTGDSGGGSGSGGMGTSSQLVSNGGSALAIFWQHEGFSGNRIGLGEGRHDLFALRQGLSNDSITSVQIESGVEVTLYEHEGFGGDSVTMQSSGMVPNGWNDRVSSVDVTVTDPSDLPGGDIDFGGGSGGSGSGAMNQTLLLVVAAIAAFYFLNQ
jgi:hypothetical protein